MVRRAKSDGARRVFLVPYNPKAPIYVALREHAETAHRPQGRFLLPMEAPGMRGSEILRARQVKTVNLEAVFARAAYKRPSDTGGKWSAGVDNDWVTCQSPVSVIR